VRTLAAVDQPTIIANLVLVASIVVIPFSTNAVGDPGVEELPLPTAFLAVNIALASRLQTLVYMLAYRRGLFLVRPTARQVQGAIVIGLSGGVIVRIAPTAKALATTCWRLSAAASASVSSG
jgi:uncharacterized membrane protein